MSFWDRWLAPGDIRYRQQAQQREEERQRQQQLLADSLAIRRKAIKPPRLDAANRSQRQNVLIGGGLAFTVLSLYVTRRALMRRQLPELSMYTASNPALPEFQPSVDAAEALGLATLNVASVAMLASGIGAKYLDVGDVEDVRDLVRKGMGYDIYGGDPDASSKADKEMEAWIAEVLARKDGVGNLQGEILQKLAEMEKYEKSTGGPERR